MNTQLIKKAALDRYISQGYTPAQAAFMWNKFLVKHANELTEKLKENVEEKKTEVIDKLKSMKPTQGIRGFIYRLGERLGHKAKELK